MKANKHLIKARLEFAANSVSNTALNEMVQGFLTCALWSSTDESSEGGGSPMDENYSISDIDNHSITKAKADCAKFFQGAQPEWFEEMEWDKIGHDFWLNRNGHGTGFWDEDELKNHAHRKLLSDLCKKFGELSPYIGDDGKVYIY